MGDTRSLDGIEVVNASSIDNRMKRAVDLDRRMSIGHADQVRRCGTGQPIVGMILVFGFATSGRSSAETTLVCREA